MQKLEEKALEEYKKGTLQVGKENAIEYTMYGCGSIEESTISLYFPERNRCE